MSIDMFDSFGKPPAYGQIAPGRDVARPQQPQQQNPLQAAVQPTRATGAMVPPSAAQYPTDPSMNAWRNRQPGSQPKIQPRENPQQFIQQWQQEHLPSEGIGGLAQALGVNRFDTGGGVLSNNELDLGGKYKVLGAEGTPGAYWYKPGMNDGPATGHIRPNPLQASIQPNQPQEQPYYQTLLAQLMQQIQ